MAARDAASGALLRGKDLMWNAMLLVPATVSGLTQRRTRDERETLARALTLGSLGVSAAFALLGGVVARWPVAMPTEAYVVDVGRWSPTEPPPSFVPPASRPEVAPAKVDRSDAIPNPVEDAPPAEPADVPSTDPASGSGKPGGSSPGPGGEVNRIGPIVAGTDSIPDFAFVPDVDPEPIFMPKPSYPEIAFAAQVEGSVVIRALVRRDGRVGEMRLERGVPLLNEAAEAAVSRWTFAPARSNGVAVSCWVVIPVRFRLNDAR